jgi:hypothetical protein
MSSLALQRGKQRRPEEWQGRRTIADRLNANPGRFSSGGAEIRPSCLDLLDSIIGEPSPMLERVQRELRRHPTRPEREAIRPSPPADSRGRSFRERSGVQSEAQGAM